MNNIECKNCGNTLTGKFCHNCGQSALSRRGPLFTIFKEILNEFHFDSKFLHSLVSLLFKPGQLTLDFISGKRLSMLPPFRMYLVISVLLLLFFEVPIKDVSNTNLYIGSQLIGSTEADPNQNDVRFMFPDKSFVGSLLAPYLDDRSEHFAIVEPQILVNDLVNSINKFMSPVLILLIPLLAIILKALYFRSSFYYVDHLIFALHFQSFLFIMALIIRASTILHPLLSLAGLLIPVYLFFAMKKVYKQSIKKTLLKIIFVLIGYIWVLYTTSTIAILLVLQSI